MKSKLELSFITWSTAATKFFGDLLNDITETKMNYCPVHWDGNWLIAQREIVGLNDRLEFSHTVVFQLFVFSSTPTAHPPPPLSPNDSLHWICGKKTKSEEYVFNTQARITKNCTLELNWPWFLFWDIHISAILFHRWRISLQLRERNGLITNVPN